MKTHTIIDASLMPTCQGDNLLVAGMARDLRSMLDVITAGLVALEESPQRTSQEILIAGMRKAIFNASRLSDNLTGFANVEKLPREMINVAELVNGLSKYFERSDFQNLRVKSIIPGEVWPVRVARHQLEFALASLVQNALEAMKPPGTAIITACNVARSRPTDDLVRIEVVDTGHGISAPERERIFQPFYSTKASHPGLGLTQVQAFADQAGGTLHIKSEPGEGTRVILMLPRGKRQLVRRSN